MVDGRFAGWGGLQPEEGDVDVAIVLHPDYWGLGKELFDWITAFAFEEKGFDVAVTYTPPRKGEQIYYYNGIINSGVIFFNTPATELVNRWAENCYQENTTDQKALSDVLEETINFQEYKKIQQWGGLKIRIFDTKIYNDFHLTRKGKILHSCASTQGTKNG